MNPNHICCLIITYNPDEIVLDIVNIILRQVGKIVIVDNNSEVPGKKIITEIAKNNKVCVIWNNFNIGIAKALNQGVTLAKWMGYKFVLTFDQDSKPYDSIIRVISEVYDLYPDKERIGAIGVNFPGMHADSYFRIPGDQLYHERDYLITSGCMLCIEAFSEVGGFREDFFIDNVDLEYSLRLRKHGKVSLITRKWGMNHKAGNPKKKKLAGLNLISTNHSSLRRYYMARNHILLSKEYFFSNTYFIAKANYFYLLSLIKMLLVEKNKKAKLISSLKGIFDGALISSRHKKLM